MKPPKSFYDFTLQLHQDLDLVYPGWDSDKPDARYVIYEDFRQGYGDEAIWELATFGEKLLADSEADLGSLWFKESKADWVIQDEGVRFLFNDLLSWAKSLA